MDIYQEVADFFKGARTEKCIIGRSLLKRNIFAVKVGEGRPIGIVQYGMHGREYITAKLAFLHCQIGVVKGSLWLLPLVNPDGALLSQTGLSSVESENKRQSLLYMNGNADFSLWKANGRGVDLNVNFPARWGEGEKNTRTAGRENYVGRRPGSERETLALMRFTEKISPDYTVSYHTKGEEIYWYFHQSKEASARDYALAKSLSKSTGYPLAFAKGSAGGYKDWCIQRLGIPSFTIEAGKDSFFHPLGEEALPDILTKNEYALYQLSKEF